MGLIRFNDINLKVIKDISIQNYTNNQDYFIKINNAILASPEYHLLILNNQNYAKKLLLEINQIKSSNDLKNLYLPNLKSIFNFLDNNSQITNQYLIDFANKYLCSDSLLCWSYGEVLNQEKKQWQPLINKFNQEFTINLQPQRSIFIESFTINQNLSDYLISLNQPLRWLFISLSQNYQSIILPILVIKQILNPKEAFNKAFLHDYLQMQRWGEEQKKVERLDSILTDILSIYFAYKNTIIL